MAVGQGQVVSWYICTVVAVLFLITRLAVKWKKFGTFGIDDGFLTVAAFCLVGDLIIQQHMWNLHMAEFEKASRDDFIEIMKMIVPGSILYVASLWAIKVALVLLYKRLAAPGSMLQKIYNGALVFLAASFTTIFFHIIFQCYPHSRRWAEDPTQGCNPKSAEDNYWLTILLNIFSDVIIMCLPISMVLKLQMPMKQKLAVAGIFALGAFVVIASIIRAYYSKLNETMLTCTVSMIETSVAIIAASLPALRSLILGNTSRIGTGSNGRHYELSSSRGRVTRNTQNGRITNTFAGGASVGGTRKASDSEDELVKDGGHIPGDNSVLEDRKDGIRVQTQFHVMEEEDRRHPRGRGDMV